MRIWVIGRGFPTKQNNMLGSFELEQAQMLARHGYEVFYPVVDLRSIRHWRRFGYYEKESGGVRVVTVSVPIGKICSAQRRREWTYKLRKLLFRKMVRTYGKPDVIHVHYPSVFSFEPFEDLERAGVKFVFTEHYTKVQNKTLSDQCLINLKDWVAHSDKLTCVGAALGESIRELTGTDKRITVIPNVVPDYFYYDERELTGSGFRFVGAGRLVECKRFDMMISAFCSAFKDISAVKLDIIGGGTEYERLRNLIRSYQCENQVSLLGVMNREEIAAYYRRCNALIMSSNLETFGVPIIEAMASGMPVITTDAMGFPDLFLQSCGYIVPKDNEAALVEAMKELYFNYSRFDRATISRYAKDTFGEEAVFKQLDEAYTA